MRRTSRLCSWCTDYVLNRLTEFESKRFERHLQTCRICRLECEDLQQAVSWVYEDYGLARDGTLAVRGLKQQIRHQQRKQRWRRSQLYLRRRVMTLLTASTACASLFALTSIMLHHRYQVAESFQDVKSSVHVHLQDLHQGVHQLEDIHLNHHGI